MVRIAQLSIVLGALALAASARAEAQVVVAYNLTSATDITGLYLAPAGSRAWGVNHAQNVRDHVLDPSRRVTLQGISPGRYDVRVVDAKGRACVLSAVDLAAHPSLEITDPAMEFCR